MRGRLAATLLVLLPRLAAGQGAEKVIDVRSARPAAGNSFEGLWSAYKKAEQRGDAETQQNALREIRRLRIERNIRSLEPMALARVAQGLERLERGERDQAEEHFRGAIGLDPHLPDAHFALALADVKSGPVGLLTGVRHTISGLTARLPTVRGRSHLFALLVPVFLLTLLLTTTVLAVTLLFRHGGLLLHDFEEALGPSRRPWALVLCGLLILLPAVAFQGYAWLPLWTLGLLFIYLHPRERLAAAVLVVATLAVGPLLQGLESRVLTQQNPLFTAGVLSIEGGPDQRATAALEDGLRQYRDDRDLLYLLAAQYRRAGRYEEAANLYREVLREDPQDSVALNNLANLEFAGGEFAAAIARYKQGIEAGPAREVGATFYYNLSLAHLQRFEYQPAQEARSHADRLANGLVRSYDSTWKYEKGDYAVVDLGLSRDELWAKFLGTPEGVRLKNLAGRGAPGVSASERGHALLNRFSAFLLVFGFVALVLSRWRGARMFTRRCVKCGTPFCKRCQLGTSSLGLCTQCHHLFVVRDGVSGPARNQKLREVQKEDARRDRIFRILSLLSPGAGQLYAQKTVTGLAFIAAWSLVLALALLAGRLLPLTEASSAVSRPWGLAVAAAILLALYVAANRKRPELEVVMPAGRRPPPRRAA